MVKALPIAVALMKEAGIVWCAYLIEVTHHLLERPREEWQPLPLRKPAAVSINGSLNGPVQRRRDNCEVAFGEL
jgi:hypothetical protein